MRWRGGVLTAVLLTVVLVTVVLQARDGGVVLGR